MAKSADLKSLKQEALRLVKESRAFAKKNKPLVVIHSIYKTSQLLKGNFELFKFILKRFNEMCNLENVWSYAENQDHWTNVRYTITCDLGTVCRNLGQLLEAKQYHEECLQMLNGLKCPDKKMICAANGNLGEDYLALCDYKEAEQYFIKARDIASDVDKREESRWEGQLSYVYYGQGKVDEALKCNKNSLNLALAKGYKSLIADGWANKAWILHALGKFKEAVEYCNKALEMNTDEGRYRTSEVLNTLAESLYRLGKTKNAREFCRESYEMFRKEGFVMRVSPAKLNFHSHLLQSGDFNKVIRRCENILNSIRNVGDRKGEAIIMTNLARAYLGLGKYQKAREYSTKSLTIGSDIGSPFIKANSMITLGSCDCHLGMYEMGIEHYIKALEISKNIQDKYQKATAYGKLSEAFNVLGQHVEAIFCAETSLTLSNEMGSSFEIANNMMNLASTDVHGRRFEKAIQGFSTSLKIYCAMGDRPGAATCLAKLCLTFACCGRHSNAITAHNLAKMLQTNVANCVQFAENMACEGMAYFLLNQHEVGMKKVEDSLRIYESAGNKIGKCTSIGEIGAMSFHMLHFSTLYQNDRALEKLSSTCVQSCEKSIRIADEIFSELRDDQNKLSFINQHLGWYVYLAHCYVLIRRVEAALLVIDQSKAKSLRIFIQNQRKFILAKRRTEIDQFSTICCHIHDGTEREKIQEIEEALLLKADKAAVVVYAFDVDNCLNVWVLNGDGEVKHKKVNRSNGSSVQRDDMFLTLKTLLSRNSVRLKYGVSNTISCRMSTGEICFRSQLDVLRSILAPNRRLTTQRDYVPRCNEYPPTNSVVKWRKTEIEEVIERYDLAAIVVGSQLRFGWNVDMSTIHLRTLFQELIEPLSKFISQGKKKLIIVPEGLLFFAPFCAFLDEACQPLSEKYSIQMTPSLHTLCSTMKQRSRSRLGYALVVGNPTVGFINLRGKSIEPAALRYSAEEATNVGCLFNAKPFVGCEAKKEAVLEYISKASVIHIAAHGDSQQGEIFLAPSNPRLSSRHPIADLPKKEDYLLQVKNILSRQLQAKLVVLNDCYTASGTISSEGVIGLARAFLAAGARVVVVALWPLSDFAAKFFVEAFYDEVLGGTSVCEALRKATKLMRESTQYCFMHHHSIWAPFTIFGEDVKFSQNEIEAIKERSRTAPWV